MGFRLVMKVAFFLVGDKQKNGSLAMRFRKVEYGCVIVGSWCKFVP